MAGRFRAIRRARQPALTTAVHNQLLHRVERRAGGDSLWTLTGSGWDMGPIPALADAWPARLSCTSASFCVIASNSGSISLTLTAPAKGRVSVRWAAGKTTVASVTEFVRPGEDRLKLALTGAGRRLLAKTKRTLRVRTTATFAPSGSAKVSVSKTIALKP